ncbi:MAG: permease [Rikenellaceae bacterium]
MNYLSELLNILNAMSPFLLLGFFFAGLLRVYVPRSAYNKYLSKPGFRSVFLAALFGVPLPLCSCGVIPTAMSIKREGATDGATVSFLIATPQTGVDSILATYGVLGLPFAIVRPIVALVVGLFGGMAVDRFSLPKRQGSEASSAVACEVEVPTKRLTFVDALEYGFVDMLQDLGKWLTIGLVIAAAITAFVPMSFFDILSDHYILNILVVLLLSIPMYVCSTGSIPIALSLLVMGVSPGAALVFLMAGPATNVATLAVLRKVLGVRTTLLYLVSIVVGAIGFAVLIDFALPAQWFTSKLSAIGACGACGEGAAWWQSASSVLFVVLLINAYIHKLRHGGHSHDVVEVAVCQRFKVSGMRCNHCKANVEKALGALRGVESLTVEITSGVVEIDGEVPTEEVLKVVRELGFEVEVL